MSEQGIIADFTDTTENEVVKLTRKLASGKCTDMSEYKSICRERHAYRRSIDNIRGIVALYYDTEDT